MLRKQVSIEKAEIPEIFHCYLDNAAIFDSSCSKIAQVWFLDKGPGFYLKKAPKGSLKNEAAMTAFFASKGLAPEVLAYESLCDDWMITKQKKTEIRTLELFLIYKLCYNVNILKRCTDKLRASHF